MSPLATMLRQRCMSPTNSRIRKYRKFAHLYQRELKILAGIRSQRAISEFEASTKRPGLLTAIAYEVIFEASPRELFPRLYIQMEREVLLRARLLHKDVTKEARRAFAHEFLAALINRLESKHSNHD
jgi:transcriptional regulator with XRE-family HTH domain